MELSKEFISKMQSLLGASAEDFFLSLNNPSTKAITVNYSRISGKDFKELADFDHEKIYATDNGFYTEGLKFNEHILSHLGVIYSQEPSAMFPVEMMGIQKGDYILDVCSAPGGKSIQILEKLNGTGMLVSNEIVYNRAKILYENLTRMGFDNFAITCNSPEDFEKTNLKFDKILVDAPCGGEGMIRKNGFDPDALKSSNIETNAKRQLSILDSIKNLLKSGGTLVYSTCTYDIRENEEVIVKFLKENPNFHLVKPDKKFDEVTVEGVTLDNFPTNYTKRRYPHLFKGEGQFMAILKKDGDENMPYPLLTMDSIQPISRKDYNDIAKELKNTIDLNGRTMQQIGLTAKIDSVADLSKLNLFKRGDTVYAVPDLYIDLSGLNVLTVGTILGTLNKGSLKIHHNFYHTYPMRFANQVDLNEEQVKKYLHGEEVDIGENLKGIVAVTYRGIGLGGGKCVNGRLKNYYPKELRV